MVKKGVSNYQKILLLYSPIITVILIMLLYYCLVPGAYNNLDERHKPALWLSIPLIIFLFPMLLKIGKEYKKNLSKKDQVKINDKKYNWKFFSISCIIFTIVLITANEIFNASHSRPFFYNIFGFDFFSFVEILVVIICIILVSISYYKPELLRGDYKPKTRKKWKGVSDFVLGNRIMATIGAVLIVPGILVILHLSSTNSFIKVSIKELIFIIWIYLLICFFLSILIFIILQKKEIIP